MRQTCVVSRHRLVVAIAALVFAVVPNEFLIAQRAASAAPVNARLAALKREVLQDVDSRRVFTQQMIDQIFSFGELGFQETETSKYLVDVLRKNGFTVKGNLPGLRGPAVETLYAEGRAWLGGSPTPGVPL